MATQPVVAQMEVALAVVTSARRVCVLTGAGISTDSGIPDFRGPDGLWTRNPGARRLSALDHYVSSREVRTAAWLSRLEKPAREVQPNAGHLALVKLERRGRLAMLVTQNVDGLHLRAGTSTERLVEIHGSLREYVCLSCGRGGPMAEVLERVRHGEEDPPCLACGGILKSAAISFGQRLRAQDLGRAELAARSCDLFVAVGTRLEVHPAAGLPALALRAGVPLLILNSQATAHDRRAACVLRGPIGEVLPALVAA